MQTRSMTRRLNCEKVHEELANMIQSAAAEENERSSTPTPTPRQTPTPTPTPRPTPAKTSTWVAGFTRKLLWSVQAVHTIISAIGGIYAVHRLIEKYITKPEERIEFELVIRHP